MKYHLLTILYLLTSLNVMASEQNYTLHKVVYSREYSLNIGNGEKVYQNQRSKSLPVRYTDRVVADAQRDRAEQYAIIL